jgi:hypothetical protein
MEIWDRAIEIQIAAAQERLVSERRKRGRQASEEGFWAQAEGRDPIRDEVDGQHPGTTPARRPGIKDWGLGIRNLFSTRIGLNRTNP